MANVFDVLPASAVPADIVLSDDLREARDQCTVVFKKLPKSTARDSVLGALGRVGKSALKHKIRHRAQIVTEKAVNWFADLTVVTDEAVNCRNHYVHGSAAAVDYTRHQDLLFFFTDTLEFVFAASDLIESGWDIVRWLNEGTVGSHPFGRYVAAYSDNLKALKTLL